MNTRSTGRTSSRTGCLDQARDRRHWRRRRDPRVGHQNAVVRTVDHRLGQRARGRSARRAQDAGGEREQQGIRRPSPGWRGSRECRAPPWARPMRKSPHAGRRQHEREQEHVTDAAAGLDCCGPVDGRTNDVFGQLHRKRWGIGCLDRTLGASADAMQVRAATAMRLSAPLARLPREYFALYRDMSPGVPVPGFVYLCSTRSKRRNRRDTSNCIIIVWFWI